MNSKLKIILGILGTTILLGVLGVVVWRMGDLRTVLQRPKAEGNERYVPVGYRGGRGNQAAGFSTASSVTGVVPTQGHYVSLDTIDEFTVSSNGQILTNYTAGFIKEDGTCEFTVTNPNQVTISNGQFNFNYNGFVVSGYFSSATEAVVTTELNDYSISADCGGTAVGGPFDVNLSKDNCTGSGERTCGSSCVDVRTNINNCGSCGSACEANERCSQGVCVPGGSVTMGQCLPPSQTHLECVNNSCVRKIGAGSNTGGCTTVGASCGGTTTCTTPANCADDKTCVGGACVTPTCNPAPTVCQTAAYANHACTLTNKTDGTACVDNSPDTSVTAGGVCQTQGGIVSKCKCTSSTTCATGKTCQLYSGKTFGECTTTQTNEANTCWGNSGVNGKCYDCDGNGVINVLDFSCFRKRYGSTVT